MEAELGITINIKSIFAAQIKRLHEVCLTFAYSLPILTFAVQETDSQYLFDHSPLYHNQEGQSGAEKEDTAVDVHFCGQGCTWSVLS